MASNRVSSSQKFAIWLGIAGIVFLADQFTKALIMSNFQLGEARVVFVDYFNIVRVHNTGAAFSFMASAGGWQRWVFTAIGVLAAVFISVLLKSHASQKLFAFALACILGGALGNVIDRILYGYVVDFLDFFWGIWHFPAFNLADSAITLGAICLLMDELLCVRKARK
jgi:signal peptidase II